MVQLNRTHNRPEGVVAWQDIRMHNPADMSQHLPKLLIFERMTKKKNYPVIQVPASGNPNWGDGARTMCFVYSKHNGNFILEGYRGEVEEYLQKNYTHYFCYFSMWHQGRSRGYWRFWKDKTVSIHTPSKISKEWKYRVVKYEPSIGHGYYTPTKQERTILKFKRLPKHWIPEFNEL